MDSTKTRRRWYQFSLRTMFVMVTLVSIPLAWVGYSLNWIRERRAALANGIVEPSLNHYLTLRERPAVAPAGLWLLGEQGMHYLSVERAPNESIDDLQRLFPEAEFHQWSRPEEDIQIQRPAGPKY